MNKSIRIKYLSLILGSIAYLCSSGRYNLEIMAWIWPFFYLVFLDTFKRKRDIILLLLSMGLMGLIKWYGAAASTVFENCLVGIALGLILAIPLMIYYVINKKFKGLTSILLLPSLYAIEEVLMNISPISMLGNIASTQASFTLFLQSASVVGSVGLTFMIIGCSSMLFYLYQHKNKEGLKALIMYSVVFMLCLGFGAIRLLNTNQTSEMVKVGVTTGPYYGDFTQGDYNPLSLEEYIIYLNQDLEEAKAEGIELLVYNEEAFYIDDKDEEEFLKGACSLIKSYDIDVILATEIKDTDNSQEGRDNNRIYMIDYKGEILYQYDKTHLVVLVETQEVAASSNPIYNGTLETASGKSITLSALICMDGEFPYFVRDSINNDCALVALPTYDWASVKDYHADSSLLRSVENGFSIARSTYDGISYISDGYGRIQVELDMSREGYEKIISYDVTITPVNTIYKQMGIIFDILPFIILGGLLVMMIIKRKKRY